MHAVRRGADAHSGGNVGVALECGAGGCDAGLGRGGRCVETEGFVDEGMQ